MDSKARTQRGHAHPEREKLSTPTKDMLIGRHSFVTFPQKLWKSLWKSRSMKLQVPENFILLAFCTRSRQNFQIAHEGRFVLTLRSLLRRPVRSHIFIFIACLLLISSSSCVKLPRRAFQASGQTAPPVAGIETSAAFININTASPEELEKLPGIGRGLAARIIAYRSEYGRFRRAEHLMMVRGISERRFRAVRALITAE
jgi:competence ComEA-like helix-hairpin-helix protein